MQEVKVIRRKSMSVLVEWTDDEGTIQRSWMPEQEITETYNGPVCRNPERGIPYGVNWSRHIELSSTPDDLNRELRRLGIFTPGEMLARPNDVRAALQATYGIDLAKLMMTAKTLQENKP